MKIQVNLWKSNQNPYKLCEGHVFQGNSLLQWTRQTQISLVFALSWLLRIPHVL